jgi:hypothetical protein
MFEATIIALEVFSLGFIISMIVAFLIKLCFMAINASTKKS